MIAAQGSASGTFGSLGLTLTSFERIEVVIDGPVNQAPTAVGDSAGTAEDTSVTIAAASLLANDTDPDSGDTKTLVSVQGAQHGTVVLNGAGDVVFTPEHNFSGTASFTYTMRDGAGATSTATVQVQVAATADAPTLVVNAAAGAEDTAIALSVAPALVDVDGSEQLSALVVSAIPVGATLTDGTRSFTATPSETSADIIGWDLSALKITPPANSDADFTVTVTATAREGASGPTASTSADLTVTVAPVADAPSLVTASASGAADASIPLDITVTLADPSETFELHIAGVPTAYSLSHGTSLEEGHWVVSAADLPALALVPNGGAATPGDFVLRITATSIDGTSTASTLADLAVSVTPGAEQLTGSVIEGYIAGATVFADTNGNGELDSGEAFTTTNANGQFTLTGGSGPLVMFGGTDVSTGLPFTGVLKAPEGSTVVTPLTTLVAELAATSGNVQAAQDAVAAAFGLDPTIDLQSYDPVQLAAGGDPDALAVLSAGIQVQSTVTQISAVTDTPESVFSAIADAITAAAGALDLAAAGTVEGIASQAGVDAEALEAVTEVVAAANESVQSATDVTQLAQAAQVAQGDATEALASTDFGSPAEIAALTETYVHDLDTQVANASPGDVDGALIGTLGDDTLTGTNVVNSIDGLDGNDQINGGGGNDLLYGSAGNDILDGGDGNDSLDGGAGRDRATYADATGGITVDLAAGTVTGRHRSETTPCNPSRSSAAAISPMLTSRPASAASAPQLGFNSFEGMGGNDTITGSGGTSISYQSASGVRDGRSAGRHCHWRRIGRHRHVHRRHRLRCPRLGIQRHALRQQSSPMARAVHRRRRQRHHRRPRRPRPGRLFAPSRTTTSPAASRSTWRPAP